MQSYHVPAIVRSTWSRAVVSLLVPGTIFALVLLCFSTPIYERYNVNDLVARISLATSLSAAQPFERLLYLQAWWLLISMVLGIVSAVSYPRVRRRVVAGAGLLVGGLGGLVALGYTLLVPSTVFLSSPCLAVPANIPQGRNGNAVIVIVDCSWDRPLPMYWALLAMLALATLFSALVLVHELRRQRADS